MSAWGSAIYISNLIFHTACGGFLPAGFQISVTENEGWIIWKVGEVYISFQRTICGREFVKEFLHNVKHVRNVRYGERSQSVKGQRGEAGFSSKSLNTAIIQVYPWRKRFVCFAVPLTYSFILRKRKKKNHSACSLSRNCIYHWLLKTVQFAWLSCSLLH